MNRRSTPLVTIRCTDGGRWIDVGLMYRQLEIRGSSWSTFQHGCSNRAQLAVHDVLKRGNYAIGTVFAYRGASHRVVCEFVSISPSSLRDVMKVQEAVIVKSCGSCGRPMKIRQQYIGHAVRCCHCGKTCHINKPKRSVLARDRHQPIAAK